MYDLAIFSIFCQSGFNIANKLFFIYIGECFERSRSRH